MLPSKHTTTEGDVEELRERLRRVELRGSRERISRQEAERILEVKSLELYEANQALTTINAELESRVSSRTAALFNANRVALDLVDTDHLTKLASRFRFHQKMKDAFDAAAVGSGRISLLLIDIDGFKTINDTFGHGCGDVLLIQIAARLSVVARRCDLVSRLGGDELAIILDDTSRDEAESFAERVTACFEPPFIVDDITIKCSASIGIACFPEHADTHEDLQRAADLALYAAKGDGRARWTVFTANLLEDHQLRIQRETDLKHSITSCEIEVWYQPLVDLTTGRNRAVEALARMKGADGEYLPPNIFIPLAEQIGLIRDLGRQVLRNALNDTVSWIEAALIDKVTVNVSADEFLTDGFVDDVLETLNGAGMTGDRLVLEITESVMVARLETVQEVMDRLQKHGVSFALDDFGCGYTNLAYLRHLPVQKVKLDLSLLASVIADEKAAAIVRHVVALCKELGFVTVCEGVETAEQLRFIQAIGCNLGQGYLFGRPVPASEAVQNLQIGANRLIRPNRVRACYPSSIPITLHPLSPGLSRKEQQNLSK